MKCGVRICYPTNIMWTFLALVALGVSAIPVDADGIEPVFVMDADPGLNYPEPVEDFDPEMARLWLQALNRPEADLQRMAAETIARAHRYGVPELSQAVPRLEEILLADTSHPASRFAAANALITLDSRSSGDKLFEASQTYGTDLRQLVEPALAEWDHASAKAQWLERLASPDTHSRELILALRGLGVAGDPSALSDIMRVIGDLRRSGGIRLEAATAAGMIADSGLEDAASQLAENTRSPLHVNQISAVRVLARHSSAAAQTLLTELAAHEEPAVAAAALLRLNEIDSTLVLPLAESAIGSPDPQVRRQGVICLLQNPEADHVGLLTPLLADPHPGLRHQVCNGLYELATEADLGEIVRDSAIQVLAADDWRGQQEASLLLGALEHQPAGERLVELLESPRAEVRIPAAWALRKVAVPETVSGIMDKTAALTELRRRQGDSTEIDIMVAHLFEALGVLAAEEAIPQMIAYVPKRADSEFSRAAAIWALGKISEGELDVELESAFVGRILDFTPQPLESQLVKRMSAIALGRIEALEQVAMMKQYLGGESNRTEEGVLMELALGWAILKLSGEESPPPEPLTIDQGQWFLEPIR